MARMIAFMTTWTTYGTWLQGNKKRYVKNGVTLDANPGLEKSNKTSLKQDAVRFSKAIRPLVKNAILQKAQEIGHKVHAVVVYSNHVHVVLSAIGRNPGYSIGRLKTAVTSILREYGFDGKVWTKGFHTGYCYNEKELQQRIDYINRHEK